MGSLVRPIPTSLPGGGGLPPHFPQAALAAAGLPLQQSYLDHIGAIKAIYDRNMAAAQAAQAMQAAAASHAANTTPPPCSSAPSSTSPPVSSSSSPPTSSSSQGPPLPPTQQGLGGGFPPGMAAALSGHLGGLGMPRPPPMFHIGAGGPHHQQIPREYPLYPWFISRHRFPGGE
jgi:hypothetical protein